MASVSEEEMATTIKEIESGTFEDKNKPEKTDISDKINTDNSHPMTASIINEADEFVEKIRNLTQNDDPSNLKKTIRTFIDNLEVIYSQI